MTSTYRRDHEPFPRNDEFERLSADGRAVIVAAAAYFEGRAVEGESALLLSGDMNDTGEDVLITAPDAMLTEPSEGERRALRRAMARFVIDSGVASLAGWV